MKRYLAYRLLWVVVLLFAVSLLTFVIFYALPSADPAAVRAGRTPTPELVESIRHQLGLDRSLPAQYVDYMEALVTRFDFGYSYQNDVAVRALILERLPATISLVVGAAVLWLAAGMAIGVISAVRRRSVVDRVLMGLSLLAISVPVYWLGLVVLYLFSNDVGQFKILPGAGSYVPLSEDPVKWFTSLLLPWLVLASAFAAIYARLLRSSMLESLSEDYIRTARAKGLSERRVVLRHALRSAMTPVVTAAGIDLGALLGGAILTESVFNVPGVGRLAFDAIQSSDLPMIQGTVLFGAFFIVMASLLVDVVYAFLDPRVRY